MEGRCKLCGAYMEYVDCYDDESYYYQCNNAGNYRHTRHREDGSIIEYVKMV